ncbi:glutathione S-transferase family protein [Hyphococcus sp.]|uniref:glutathione S-transferase family protein n=1 Tax=Hyphococcus sp. TaxID=2038636 RepID=UPI003753902C
MTLKLIHFPMTRSLRIVWALDELGIDADIETRVFDRAKLKEPEYRALNPLGKTPVFFDGDKRMIESVAIIEYLANKYANGKLSRNAQDTDYGDYLQWMEFGEAGMGGYVGQLLGHTMLLPKEHRIESMRLWAVGEMKNCLDFLEAGLEGRDYLLGEFSLADISIGYILFLTQLMRNGELMGPRTAAYFERLTSREAWKRATALKP